MSGRARFRAAAVAIASAILLAVAGTAIAAGGPEPKLLSPNHRQVAPGAIQLVVEIPLKPARGHGFITISPTRKLDKYGHLKQCFSTDRCDFVRATHWKGDKYRDVAEFNFPGYWAVTPGRYYWQAEYYKADYTANYYSAIGSFVVK